MVPGKQLRKGLRIGVLEKTVVAGMRVKGSGFRNILLQGSFRQDGF